MVNAYVLYISDNIVGPCLHLIRLICNPDSHSKPHVTVRTVVRLQDNLTALQNLYVDNIDIVGPGSFGLEGPKAKSVTVFVRCNSEVLEAQSYKPDYPHSVFHITLYEGINFVFANQLLQTLQRFPWGFTVTLPEQTKLSKIEITGRNRSRKQEERVYPDEICSLFRKITSKRLSTSFLTNLTDMQRLKLVEDISIYLHNSVSYLPKIQLYAGLTSQNIRKDSLTEQESDYYNLASNEKLTHDYELLAKNKTLHLTPPELAHDMIRYAISNFKLDTESIDFGDPAIGTGVFFSSLINNIAQDKINSAIGIEIDPLTAIETRGKWAHKGLIVESGDYLHMDKLPLRNLIIANPPYMRYQKLPPTYREKLQERASSQIGMRVSGQSSLYVYFLLLSHGWMRKDALAVWLIPSEFMETNYGNVLRKYLTEKVELIRIHKFEPENIQFETVLVTSSVVVFRNRPPSPSNKIILSSGGRLQKPHHTEYVDLSALVNESKWKIPWVRRRIFSSPPPRIGDLFRVHRGLATGANTFFIMERSVAAQRGIPDVALRPILPKARTLKTDIIDSDIDGYPHVYPQLCLLDCALSQEEIRITHPRLLEYLHSAPPEVLNSTLVSGRHPWYSQEQRQPSPFLCTYMGRGSNKCMPLYFLWNKSNAVASNTYLMLYPREALAKLITERTDTLLMIFALLKEISSQSLEENGRVYGGGLHKIEPKELLNVRLLSSPSWLEKIVQEPLPLL